MNIHLHYITCHVITLSSIDALKFIIPDKEIIVKN